jgi:hypothetical protein
MYHEWRMDGIAKNWKFVDWLTAVQWFSPVMVSFTNNTSGHDISWYINCVNRNPIHSSFMTYHYIIIEST